MYEDPKIVAIHKKISILNQKIDDLLKPKVLKNKFLKPSSSTMQQVKMLEDEKYRLTYLIYYLS